jgi:hypothetical protein
MLVNLLKEHESHAMELMQLKKTSTAQALALYAQALRLYMLPSLFSSFTSFKIVVILEISMNNWQIFLLIYARNFFLFRK